MVNKLGVVEEEADETLYWFELLAESRLVPSESFQPMVKEAHQLLSMVVSSRKTLRERIGTQVAPLPKSKIENRKS